MVDGHWWGIIAYSKVRNIFFGEAHFYDKSFLDDQFGASSQ